MDRQLELYNPKEKFGVMDLKTKFEDGTLCNVEIQLHSHEYEIERFLLYLCNMYARQLKRGESYKEIQKTISIVIVDHEIEVLKDFETLNVKWEMRDNINGKKVLTDKFELCIIEMKKAKRVYEKDSTDRLSNWMLFIDSPESSEVRRIMERNKDIKEAMKCLEEISEDDKLRELAEYKETAAREEAACLEYAEKSGYEKGIEKGIKSGKIDGEIKKQKEIAKNMLKEKVDLQLISRVTGLTKEEIEKLK